ncbi:MAG: preprotein translocase subunit SecA [Candidatus Saccharimonadales bacterium]
MKKILTKIFDPGSKQLRQIQPLVDQTNDLEAGIKSLNDKDLAAKTTEFKNRLEKDETLDDILPEAFAVVREVARRKLEQRHFDVQLLGGIVLHKGDIAEMRTGEGKTLVATLPIYLNALSGKGVHLVTVNDYLARRDAGWMADIYAFLGLSVGVLTGGNKGFIYDPETVDESHSDPRLQPFREVPKKETYACDIVYGTNNEFGFDYLRDNMAPNKDAMVQRELSFAIVDEVDSILIDEARTPLIISAPADKSTDTYQQFATIAKQLKEGDHYSVDEKQRAVSLTDDGVSKVEQILGVDNLYDPEFVQSIFHLEQALKAKVLFKKDKNYVVRDGEVIIVDEFTGRLMAGRRYSEGLHQAIEAKEGVRVLQESVTLATVSFQNYFRLYDKLAGMTGTAKTEEEEFQNIYNLDVAEVPTNQPAIRTDLSDRIYKTEDAKFNAIVKDVTERQARGQPVLIGTVSIERNEIISEKLSKAGINHEVLNAKNNEQEADIIEQAGQPGVVTLATNIAGRGTDIVLGEGVVEQGGLHVLGSERHESRRIDNQLRGRTGRQGNPGSTQFYVSLEDEIMRIFGGERISNLMGSLGVDEDTPIENNMVSKAIENAQKRVESHNYDIRKNVLQYDDVMNRHREAIYARRRNILEEKPLKEDILAMVDGEIRHAIEVHSDVEDEEIKRPDLFKYLGGFIQVKESEFKDVDDNDLVDKLTEKARKLYEAREKEFDEEIMRTIERHTYLQALDRLWMDHLEAMDHLRQGIHLRSVGQRDPLVEYKKESHIMFNNLEANIEREVATTIYRMVPRQQTAEEAQETELTRAAENAQIFRSNNGGQGSSRGSGTVATVRKGDKVGRNDPCPCGSGLKYKKCALINAPEHKG